MARQINRLTARAVETLSKPGRHADGGGLYLSISPDGARRRWTFFYKLDARQREMGLGSAGRGGVPLARARELAREARDWLSSGHDPIEARKKGRSDREFAAKAERRVTFGQVADELIEQLAPGFRSAKTVRHWRTSLGAAEPALGRVQGDPKAHAEHLRALRVLRATPVAQVETENVLAVLRPIWLSKPETASNMRMRIERVLDAARAAGHRTGENPARLKRHLSEWLPNQPRLVRGHHAAMPYPEVPAFMDRLRAQSGVAARALEYVILNAARSGEVRGMTWSEVDIEAGLWTVPRTRMKGAREHRVPLAARSVEILREMAEVRSGDLVFPGARAGKPLSVMAFDMLLRRMRVDVTTHGFRSAFRDWAGEETHFAREIAEQALAHIFGDATERAYRRGDALQKRRELMEAWACWCEPRPAKSRAA